MKKLLFDFPADKVEDGQQPPPSQNRLTTEVDDEEICSQRPLTQKSKQEVDIKGLELYAEYIQASKERASYEIEREVLFLAEKSVQETPFEIQETQEITPVLRQDFVLQL